MRSATLAWCAHSLTDLGSWSVGAPVAHGFFVCS